MALNIVYKSTPSENPSRVTNNGTLLNTQVDGNFLVLENAVETKAPLASPALTGTPTAPTATAGTNTTQIATTAYTDAAVETFRTATKTLTNKTLETPVITTNATVPLVQGSTTASGTLTLSSTSNATKGSVIVGTGADAVRLNTVTNGFVKTSGSNGTLTYDTNTYYNTGGTDVAVADGGTGLSTTPSNGQLLIGNGSGYTLATLTDGTGITVTEGTGSITITNSGVTGLTGTTNRITVSASTGSVTLNLPQDIHTGASPSFAQVTVAADPTQALQAATKQYVDNAILGLDIKASVKFATTASIANLSTGAPNTVDGGATLLVNDRILVKNQGTPSQNGIYIVSTVGTGANGIWVRASDMDNWNEVPGSFVFVEQGTTNADTGWVCTADAGGTLGTTSITWTQFAGTGSVTSGTGISVTGNQVALATGNVLSLHNLGSNGIVARTASDTVTNVTLTGTTNRLTVNNGDGVSGNPTFDIASTYVGQTSITTLGTIATGTWNATAIADGKIASALTGKTYNGLSLTAAATGFTVAGGTTSKTLTVSKTITLDASNDTSTLNIGTGGTLASAAYVATGTSGATIPLLNGANTWSNTNTVSITSTSTALTVTNAGTGSGISVDKLAITTNATLKGSSTGVTTFTSANASATNYAIAFPAAAGTVALTTSTVDKATNLIGGNAGTLLGSIPYQSNTDVTVLLPPNTLNSKRFLTQQGNGTNGAVPAWGTVVAGDITSGQIAIANGGTGQSTATAAFDALAPTTTQGDTIYHNGNDNVRLAKGTAGQALTMNAGSTAPQWSTLTLENLPDAWVKKTARLATTANLTATYANGTAGVGATLTNSGTLAALSLDGTAVAVNDRILVKDQTTTFQNGIYVVTNIGSGSVAWVLTRAADADSPSELAGAAIAVDIGATNGGKTFDTDFISTGTIGTTAVTWARVLDTSTIGVDVQAYSSKLVDIAALAVSDSNFIVGNGTTWVAESGATVRTSLGLGTSATVNTGTSGATIPLLNGANTWSSAQTFSVAPVINALPTGTGVASTATASTLVARDADANIIADAFVTSSTSTATAAGSTTLTVGSTDVQVFTGTTTQTVVLPVTSTLTLGRTFTIINNSTGLVTVNSSGGNTVQVIGAGETFDIKCALVTGTTAASWKVGGGKVFYDANTSLTAATGATNLDLSTSEVFVVTMSGNCTFTFTNPPASGKYKQVMVVLIQGTGGNKTMSVTNARYTDGVAPVLSTAAGAKDVLTYFTYNGGTDWFGSFSMAAVA